MSANLERGAWAKYGRKEERPERREYGHTQARKRRVAVIGSGLAGLTTAYLLDKSNFDVEIFEAGPQPSLDGASVSIPRIDPPTGKESIVERVDVPMRAFAGGYYTSLTKMYRYFDIPFRSQKFLFMFSRESTPGSDGDGSAYFIHSSNNHRLPPIKPNGRTWLQHITELLYLWLTYSYFTLCCFLWPPSTRTFNNSSAGGGTFGETESLREYIARIRLPQYFTQNYLLPLMSSVTTCPHETLLDFPASDVTGYKKRMHKQPHYMIEGGVCQIQSRLLAGGNIKLCTGRTVVKVERVPRRGGVVVRWSQRAESGALLEVDGGRDGRVIYEKMFDQVVLAVSPHVVGKIYQRLEAEMGRIPCCEAQVIVHYDGRVVEDVLQEAATEEQEGEVEEGLQGDIFEEKFSKNCLDTATTTSRETTLPVLPNEALASLLRTNSKLLAGSDAHTIQLRTTATKDSPVVAGKDSLVTESTHIHPPGVLLTTTALQPIDPTKILGETTFIRVLRTPESRDIVEKLLSPRGYKDSQSHGLGAGEVGEWKNGDEGVWLAGGWCWDGMVLLEGCVRSAVGVAKGLGAKIPWEEGYQDENDDGEEGEEW